MFKIFFFGYENKISDLLARVDLHRFLKINLRRGNGLYKDVNKLLVLSKSCATLSSNAQCIDSDLWG